jgi:hypothetical protein
VLGGDTEMGDMKTIELNQESRTVEISFVQLGAANDHSLDCPGQPAPGDMPDGGQNDSVGQNSSELADTYHGL